MKRITENSKLTFQVIFAGILILAGLTLLFLGFYAPPQGDISNSVLVAYGEASTFAGSLLGLDYSYKFRTYKIDAEERNRTKHEENKEE